MAGSFAPVWRRGETVDGTAARRDNKPRRRCVPLFSPERPRQFHELLDGKLFWPGVEVGNVGREIRGARREQGREDGLQGIADSLAALVEGVLDDRLEQFLVAVERRAGAPTGCRKSWNRAALRDVQPILSGSCTPLRESVHDNPVP